MLPAQPEQSRLDNTAHRGPAVRRLASTGQPREGRRAPGCKPASRLISCLAVNQTMGESTAAAIATGDGSPAEPRIGKIKRVPLRDVWKHEAHNLTTWLEENIDVLNEALDINRMSSARRAQARSASIS
jgi:hypothetical protein